ncbi:peptidylprolyl isomerase [Cryomorphaceae bacterium]|nr:peptidylprolyl isomerase [Cryomorphaceae bacterium]
MATLQNIRKRSGLLIGIVGFAMLAFILTDLLSSGGSILQRDRNTILEINGEKINSIQFNQRVQKRIDDYIASSGDVGMTNASRDQFFDLTYDEILREGIMGSQYEELGIQVTGKELWDVIISNPSINTNQGFQRDGQFDEALVKMYIDNLEQQRSTDPQMQEAWVQWKAFEDQLYTTQFQSKYNNLISSGIIATNIEGEMSFRDRNTTASISLIYRPYTSINDSAVSVSESDIKAYYNKNKEELYKQEDARDIEYVVFNIVPSEDDVNAAARRFDELMQDEVVYNNETKENDTLRGFINTKDDSAFINANSEQSRYFGQWLTEGLLDARYDSLMFASEPGYIYGPYRDGDFYRAAKLIDKGVQPDSVRARHILIAFAGAERAAPEVVRSPQAAQVLADSLFGVVKDDPSQFASLASQYSDGPSKTKGGDLEWFQPGMMTTNFNNYAFNNETGDIGLVITEFGFHIIEITDQGGASPVVKVGILDQRILPSNATEDRIYAESNDLAGSAESLEAFRAKAQELGAEVRPATNLRPLDKTVPGIADSRVIVRWSFEDGVEEGEVNIFDVSNQVVVAFLTNIKEEGYASLEDVRSQVENRAIREKKAESLSAELSGASNLNDLAQSLGTQVINATAVSFANSSVSGVGNEPMIAAAAVSLPLNTLSEPIVGNSGVFVIQVNSRNEAATQESYATEMQQITNQYGTRITNDVFESLKAQANVVDNRARFQ